MPMFSKRDIALAFCSRKEFPYWFIRTVAEGTFDEPEMIWRETFFRISASELTDSQQEREWRRTQLLRQSTKKLSLQKIIEQGRRSVAQLGSDGVHVTTCFDEEYPQDFFSLEDPPPVLWSTKPLRPFFENTRLSVIGSRQLTYYGERATKAFVKVLVGAYKLTIVSGCAQGADWIAHQTAVEQGGKTIGFLGSGIQQLSPRCAELGRMKNAVLISEFPPHVPNDKWRFPFRNRLIAAAAKGVFIIEAGEKSGTMITASAAMKIGREVMVLTQPWESPNAVVFRKLSQDGARVIVRVEDVLDQLGMPYVPSSGGFNITTVLASAEVLAEREFLHSLILMGGKAFLAQIKKPEQLNNLEWEEGRLNLEARGIIRQRLGAYELACMVQS